MLILLFECYMHKQDTVCSQVVLYVVFVHLLQVESKPTVIIACIKYELSLGSAKCLKPAFKWPAGEDCWFQKAVWFYVSL